MNGVRAALALVAALAGFAATAHEVRPALLRIDAAAEGRYRAVWKLPLAGGRLLPLAPVFPEQCAARSTGFDNTLSGAIVQRFDLDCPSGLRGGTVAIDGLSRTITDVMVQATLADGSSFSGLLKPSRPALTIGDGDGAAALGYLTLGIEHLLLGFDHILFVLTLMFFLHRFGPLAKAVTAFTVAHSITLALSALQLVHLPQAPVEAVIALSILFLAVEKLRGVDDSISVNHTWVVAFAFGLLHGFGFAGALADIGLPRENLALALLLFNLGVEIGQLAVVAAALAVVWAVGKLGIVVPRHVVRAPLYLSGCLAGYWFVSRTEAIVA